MWESALLIFMYPLPFLLVRCYVSGVEFSYPDFQHSTLGIPSSLPVGESGCHYWRRKNLECEEVESERQEYLVHMC